MNEYIINILKEMCLRVKANYNSIDFLEDNWFQKYQWSQDDENSFIEWLSNYLYKNKKAYAGLASIPSLHSKKNAEKLAREFVLNYGWSYIQDKSIIQNTEDIENIE